MVDEREVIGNVDELEQERSWGGLAKAIVTMTAV
jgi:hypothetical protein